MSHFRIRLVISDCFHRGFITGLILAVVGLLTLSLMYERRLSDIKHHYEYQLNSQCTGV